MNSGPPPILSLEDSEADTCRKFVVPRLQAAGWEADPHSLQEQVTFTDGRVVVSGSTARRQKGKRADYLLRYTRDFPIAVVEAKKGAKKAGDGLQQAKDYAQILGLSFAYATNGEEMVEFDFLTGQETEIAAFPTPAALWERLAAHQALTEDATARLLTPSYHLSGLSPRYYQIIAINRVLQAVLAGKTRMLLTMATGTGKTAVAFQICWKLWSARWNRTGAARRPKILFLADRNVLVDDPKDKTFLPFGDARHKIEGGEALLGRDIYFSTYQSLAEDERRPGLYRDFPADFFDLIVVDECHRGSARETSSWREILEYFQPAVQLGMTATPKREDNADSYRYFGNPLYTYSLRQGIEDGFLAPYRVHRIVSEWDAAGWRPSQGELDRYGRAIPDGEYETKDFERLVALKARTQAIAKHLADFMSKTDRFAKTIVFCVDQEHADEMRRALNNLNADLVKQYPDYVCRVTADEGDIGRGHLSRFQELETRTPAILTTSQMLTTGVDAPTCKNVVLARVVGTMTEFKQMIGRGTRIRDDYDKLSFHILDYTGSATRLFADPDFDGEPDELTEEEMDEDEGEPVEDEKVRETPPPYPEPEPPTERRKFYFDGGSVEIAAHLVYDLAPDGTQLRVVRFVDYTAEKVRQLCPTSAALHDRWIDPTLRAEVVAALAERGIHFDALAEETGQPDADPFDLLCHLAFNAPLRTRTDRADRLRRDKSDFFDQYGPQARVILSDLLDRYAQQGVAELVVPDALKLPPISGYGTVPEIVKFFGGANELRAAVSQMQTLLYAS